MPRSPRRERRHQSLDEDESSPDQEEEDDEEEDDALDGKPQWPEFVWLVSCKSSDSVRVSSANLQLSGLGVQFLDRLGPATADDDRPEMFLQVAPETLRHLKLYLDMRQGRPMKPIPWPLRSSELGEQVPKESLADVHFIDWVGESKRNLYLLSTAAAYMDIPCLLQLCSAKIASFIVHQPLCNVQRLLNPAPVPAVRKRRRRLPGPVRPGHGGRG